MRLRICAIGRLRSAPEQALIADYLSRFDKVGRQLGLGPVEVTELEDKKRSGQPGEADLLRRAIPPGAFVVALDERGQQLTSPQFARKLGDWRDTGHSQVAILIGGADGLHPVLRAQADYLISFGHMVWPHALVRVMLAEQLYRGATILAGGPYHRA